MVRRRPTVGFRRDSRSSSDRTDRARRWNQRAHSRASRSRVQFEQLETRVLLFSSPIVAPVQILAVTDFPPQSSIALFASPPSIALFASPPRSGGGGVVIVPSIGENAQIGETPFTPARVTSSIQAGPPTFFEAGQNGETGQSVIDPIQEGRWQAPATSSEESTVVVTEEGGGMSGPGEFGGVGLVQAHIDRMLYLEAGESPFGSGLSDGENGLASPADEVMGGATGPAAVRDYLEETSPLARPFMESTFPGGTGYPPLAFIVRGMDEPGPSPFVAPDGVVDSGDAPSPQGAVFGANTMALESLNASYRIAPAPGRFVTKTSSSGSSSTTETGTTGVSPSNSNALFISSVQRQDESDSSGGGSAPAQRLLSGGTSAFQMTAFADEPAMTAGSAAQSNVDTAFAGPQLNSDEIGSGSVSSAVDQAATGTSDGFNVRIPTGPFASRNAGPLGPILASVGGDPTPEVDRDARALYQEIERRETAGSESDVLEYLVAQAGSSEEAPGGEVSSGMVSLQGAGRLSKSTTTGSRSRCTDLGGLVSAIGASGRIADVRTAPTLTPHRLDPSQVAFAEEAAAMPGDEPAYAVFIKAACGIAFGLAMSSRALFPSLLMGAQNRIRARLRGSRAKDRRR